MSPGEPLSVKKAPGASGCFWLLLGFAVFQGGIVLAAVALHRLLVNPGTFAPEAVGMIVAGVLLAFSAPRIFMLGGHGRPRITFGQAAEAQDRKQAHMARWGTSAALYLAGAFGSVFIPVPRLGAISVSQGDGLWEQHPEQAVAMGAMYFAALGMCELYGGFRRGAP